MIRNSVRIFYIFILVFFSNISLAEIVAGDFELVSKQRVSRTDFEYTYRLNAINNGSNAFSEVIASVVSGSSHTKIIDNTIIFDLVPSNGTLLSSDTFIIKQDRQYPFLKESLSFTFSSRNAAPTANSGSNLKVLVGEKLTLDGSLSEDLNKNKLSFFWSIVAAPNDSSALLLDAFTVKPSFQPDKAGIYIVELIVSDNTLASVPSTIEILVEQPEITITDSIQLKYGADPALLDTDNDGLSDSFEILQTAPFLMPDKKDSNEDGISDGDEDTDNDGLTTLEELKIGTSPLSDDTDGDGLKDKDEIDIHKTDPLDPDTDSDGLTDGQEILTETNPLSDDTNGNGVIDSQDVLISKIHHTSNGINLLLKGQGFLGDRVIIQKPTGTNSQFHNAIGQVGKPIEINLDKLASGRLQSAKLTLSFDPNAIGSDNPDDLRVFTFNEELKFWIPAAKEQVINDIDNTITIEVKHFSMFAVFNIKKWKERWKSDAKSCSDRELPVDMVFTLDSSGSMKTNDPNNLRLSAAKSFSNAFIRDDRGAVVDFDGSSKVLQTLTSDKGALKLAIDRVDSNGSTNISSGVSAALSILKAEHTEERKRVIILLTDGEGNYSNSLTTDAAKENINIFTIGLGDSVNNSLLSNIASGTGGTFSLVQSADQLPSVFRTIEIESGIAGDVDTDGDGLTDKQEIEGVIDISNQIFTSDPNLIDTDGDGLTDYEEVGRPLPLKEISRILHETFNIDVNWEDGCYHNVISDPYKKDTDGDGLLDGSEVDGGSTFINGTILGGLSNPRLFDTDGDGLSDFEERSWGTNPNVSDTDGDGFSDSFEASRIDDDYHPLSFTVVLSGGTYFKQYVTGAICGEICNISTITEIAGNISASIVPVVGTGRDGIDFVALIFKGEYVSGAITLVGVIPAAGDIAATIGKAVKFITKNSDKADDILNILTKLSLPDSVIKKLVTKVGEGALQKTFSTLKNKGFSDETLVRLLKGKVGKVLDLAAAVSRPGAKVVKDGVFYEGTKGWKDAEKFLRKGLDAPKAFPKIPPPRTFIRYPDAVVDGIGKEAKTGFVKNSDRIRTQISKDLKLLEMGALPKVEWHFFPSGRSNSIGASTKILDLLDDAGIEYIFHIP